LVSEKNLVAPSEVLESPSALLETPGAEETPDKIGIFVGASAGSGTPDKIGISVGAAAGAGPSQGVSLGLIHCWVNSHQEYPADGIHPYSSLSQPLPVSLKLKATFV
jgi:hypothetical protein